MQVPARNSYINYDVKDLVNDWVQGTHANNGFALVAIAEANNLGASMQCEVLNNRTFSLWTEAQYPVVSG